MAGTLHVCFLWHMHQPSYRDPVSGEVILPWVRLHGVKDYTDMAALTEACEAARVTFNVVPGLWDQLDEAAAPGHASRERFWRLSQAPADRLDDHDARFIQSHFFSLHHPTMLEPYPRYRELRDRVRAGEPLDVDALRDLQVWFDLAWCGDTVRADDDVAALFAKGRGFDEADKRTLADAQRRALGRVTERYRRLVDTGRVEITTTPYYHPILPLLIDSDLARIADPTSPLPAARFRWPGDADAHVRRAIAAHAARFDAPPAGMWPAEGAVAEAILPILAGAGVRWIVTDEAMLERALGAPDLDARRRYRPWRRGEVTLCFRDHALSDRIGFIYSAWDRRQAHRDFVERLEAIRRDLDGASGLVTIALDGENCWEHYPGGSVAFLPGLYEAIADVEGLRLSTFSEALDDLAPGELPELPPGSWIDGTFRTWLGDPTKDRAWELLAAARTAVGREMATLERDDPTLADLVMRAEASDWWWWFGHGHSSPFDADFDALFRAYLAAIYHRLGRPAPGDLRRPVHARDDQGAPAPESRSPPIRRLSVTVDGRRDWFYEWIGAGQVTPTFGAIHRADATLRHLTYGNDGTSVYLRMDMSAPAREALDGREFALELEATGADGLERIGLWPADGVVAAADDVFEAAVALDRLGVERLPTTLRVRLALAEPAGGVVERYPPSDWAELVLLDAQGSAMNHTL